MPKRPSTKEIQQRLSTALKVLQERDTQLQAARVELAEARSGRNKAVSKLADTESLLAAYRAAYDGLLRLTSVLDSGKKAP